MKNLDYSPFVVRPTARFPILSIDEHGKGSNTLLIVDDDATARLLLRLALNREPYRIYEATDGEMAVSMCTSCHPDLILLNITLPRTDGITVLQQIRQINQNVIILVVSALSMQHWIDEALANGADGFIAKPFSLIAMRQMVAYLLGRNPSKQMASNTHLFS